MIVLARSNAHVRGIFSSVRGLLVVQEGVDFAPAYSALSAADGNEPRDGRSAPRDHHLLTGLHALEQAGQVRLGFVNGDAPGSSIRHDQGTLVHHPVLVDVDESDASLLFEGRKAMEWKQGLPLPEKTVAEESAGDSIPDSKATKKK